MLDSNIIKDINIKCSERKYLSQFTSVYLLHLNEKKHIVYNGVKLKTSYMIDIIHGFYLNYFFKNRTHISLYSLILKEKYGKNYNKYIDYLLDESYIYLAKNYSVGKNSKVYSLNSQLIEGDVKKVKNYDKILIRKKNESLNNDLDNLSERIINPSNIIEDAIKVKLINDLVKVDINEIESLNYIKNENLDKNIRVKNNYSINAIKEKQIYYHFDEYGRMHTNYTVLKSEIRKRFTTINNNPTIEFDIKNSQPLFLFKLIYNDVDNYLIDKDELDFYKNITFSGKFYKYISDNSDFKTKEQIKSLVYKVFFGRNLNDIENLTFKALFPTIYRFISFYKKRAGNYKILAHTLQRMESNLVYNKIIKEIIEMNSNITIYTVHDSIIIEEKYKNEVKSIFYENIKKEFII